MPTSVAAVEPVDEPTSEADEADEAEESEPIESADGPSDDEKRRRAALEVDALARADAKRTLDADAIEELQAEFGLKSELSEDYAALVGRMTRDSDKALAVLKPGVEIHVYAEGGRDAEREWKAELSPKSWVGKLASSAEAAQMVDDGRLELVVQEIHEKEDGTATVELAVYKVIGIAVARVFGHAIANRAEDGSWSRTHEVRFLNGERGRWIEITPSEGGEAEVYRWNHWEGMFRIPRAVPTAPRRENLGTDPKPPVSQYPRTILRGLERAG